MTAERAVDDRGGVPLDDVWEQAPRRQDLTGKVAAITGASSGLGVTMALALASAGASVMLAARRVEALAEVECAIGRLGGRAAKVRTDVSRAEDCERLAAAAVEAFGRIDILVNNAGVAHAGWALKEPLSAWDAMIATNLSGAYYCARACAARMTDGGSIINVSSVLAARSEAIPHAGYNASKAGMVGLTIDLARQWAGRGIRVNALLPGYFVSEMSAKFPEGYLDTMAAQRIPLRRIGDAADLVGPTLFLASSASSYMTGQTLVVDGGLTST